MRTGNEDGFLARPPVFAVADGMGGHQAGEVASGLAIDLLADAAERTPTPSLDEVVTTIETSNTAIRREARSRADLSGMGTTCTVIVVDVAIHVAHVGDSRAYRLRDDELVQLTDDHSLVATLVREGIMAPADALTDGRRNIITRALGADDEVLVDVVTVDRRVGDRLLVCSDGLHGQVDDAAIAAVLREETDPGRAADRLVDLANAAGGDDNVTVIVIDPDDIDVADAEDVADLTDVADVADAGDVGDVDPATDARPRRRRAIRRAALILVLILAVAAIAFVIAAWLWVRSATPA